MCPDKRVHLDVALEADEGTIRGSVGDGAGTVVEFTGWLELMSTFDSARAGRSRLRRHRRHVNATERE